MMHFQDLGRMPYRAAWARQERAHEEVVAGAEEIVFFVEHPPVITFGRRPGGERNLLATEEQLRTAGVELVQSDRGGDVTLHAPGQLVAYPIIRLADHRLSVGGYVHRLEEAVIATLATIGIQTRADPAAIGVWTEVDGIAAKICAIGVRIRRGVSLHGLALNLDTDLDLFKLIIPCGLADRPVTSIRGLLGGAAPTMDQLKSVLFEQLQRAIER